MLFQQSEGLEVFAAGVGSVQVPQSQVDFPPVQQNHCKYIQITTKLSCHCLFSSTHQCKCLLNCFFQRHSQIILCVFTLFRNRRTVRLISSCLMGKCRFQSCVSHHVPISSSVYSTLGIGSPLSTDRSDIRTDAFICVLGLFLPTATVLLSVSEGDVSDHFPPLPVSRIRVALFRFRMSHCDYILCHGAYWSYTRQKPSQK